MIQRLQTNDTLATKDISDKYSSTLLCCNCKVLLPMMLLWVLFQPNPADSSTHDLSARSVRRGPTRSRNYSPSYQLHMFPRAVMSSSTAYGAVVCIRGLASFSGIRISTEFV